MNSSVFLHEKTRYRVRLEKALIVTLGVMMILFTLSRRIPERAPKELKLPKAVTVMAERVPTTRHGGVPNTPTVPQVPIPVEDEYMPEDETIETTELVETMDLPSYEVALDDLPSFDEFMGFDRVEDDRDKAVSGVVTLSVLVNEFGQVDSVRVLGNTTGSQRLQEEAIFTALRTRYRLKSTEAQWVERPFHFKIE
jgi:TonB family protein